MVLKPLKIMNDGEIVKEGHLKRLKVKKWFSNFLQWRCMTASSSDSDFANSDAKLNVDLCLDESNIGLKQYFL